MEPVVLFALFFTTLILLFTFVFRSLYIRHRDRIEIHQNNVNSENSNERSMSNWDLLLKWFVIILCVIWVELCLIDLFYIDWYYKIIDENKYKIRGGYWDDNESIEVLFNSDKYKHWPATQIIAQMYFYLFVPIYAIFYVFVPMIGYLNNHRYYNNNGNDNSKRSNSNKRDYILWILLLCCVCFEVWSINWDSFLFDEQTTYIFGYTWISNKLLIGNIIIYNLLNYQTKKLLPVFVNMAPIDSNNTSPDSNNDNLSISLAVGQNEQKRDFDDNDSDEKKELEFDDKNQSQLQPKYDSDPLVNATDEFKVERQNHNNNNINDAANVGNADAQNNPPNNNNNHNKTNSSEAVTYKTLSTGTNPSQVPPSMGTGTSGVPSLPESKNTASQINIYFQKNAKVNLPRVVPATTDSKDNDQTSSNNNQFTSVTSSGLNSNQNTQNEDTDGDTDEKKSDVASGARNRDEYQSIVGAANSLLNEPDESHESQDPKNMANKPKITKIKRNNTIKKNNNVHAYVKKNDNFNNNNINTTTTTNNNNNSNNNNIINIDGNDDYQTTKEAYITLLCLKALFLLFTYLAFNIWLYGYFSAYYHFSVCLSNVHDSDCKIQLPPYVANKDNITWVIGYSSSYHLKNIISLVLIWFVLTFDVLYGIIKYQFVKKFHISTLEFTKFLLSALHYGNERRFLFSYSFIICIPLIYSTGFVNVIKDKTGGVYGTYTATFSKTPFALVLLMVLIFLVPAILMVNVGYGFIVNIDKTYGDKINRICGLLLIGCAVILSCLLPLAREEIRVVDDLAMWPIAVVLIIWDIWYMGCDIIAYYRVDFNEKLQINKNSGMNVKATRLFILGFIIGIDAIVIFTSTFIRSLITPTNKDNIDITSFSITYDMFIVALLIYGSITAFVCFIFVKYDDEIFIADDKAPFDSKKLRNHPTQCSYIVRNTFRLLCIVPLNSLACYKRQKKKHEKQCANCDKCSVKNIDICCKYIGDPLCCDLLFRCIHIFASFACPCCNCADFPEYNVADGDKYEVTKCKFNKQCKSVFVAVVSISLLFAIAIMLIFEITCLYFVCRGLMVLADVSTNKKISNVVREHIITNIRST